MFVNLSTNRRVCFVMNNNVTKVFNILFCEKINGLSIFENHRRCDQAIVTRRCYAAT